VYGVVVGSCERVNEASGLILEQEFLELIRASKFIFNFWIMITYEYMGEFIKNATTGRSLSELHNLYTSPSIIGMIKSRRMRWARHVTRIGAKWNAYRIVVGKSEGKRLLGRPTVGGLAILK
jgi:hypothetical protein